MILTLLLEVIGFAVVLGVALAAPPRLSVAVRRFLHGAGRLARHPRWAVVAVGLAALAVAVLLSSIRLPVPQVHDEFSYLLAADTFAHGRVTNPTHPMWEHFESFHIIQQPTYMSKYPPGQGMFLAAGQVLTGQPIVGVWLSTALAAAAVCWMLQGWVPGRWALLGGLLVVFHVAVQRFWGQSFWGGNAALLGGAMVFGSLPRIMRETSPRDAVILALGLVLLANTRPFEGLIVSIIPAAALVAWTLGKTRPPLKTVAVRFALPLLAVSSVAAAAMAYYNVRVTGDPLLMPYQVHEATYGATPLFLWQTPAETPRYRHQPMAKFHLGWERSRFDAQQSLAGLWNNKKMEMLNLWHIFLRPTMTVPILAIPFILRRRRMWIVAGTLIVVLLTSSSTTWLQPHYIAPALCLLFLVVVQGMRHLRCWNRRGRLAGSTIVLALVVTYLFMFAFRTGLYAARVPRGPAQDRAKLLKQLEHTSDRHLVVVRYAPQHDTLFEWVYNRADIDAAKVVWAREMNPKKDRELLEYFKDHRTWLLLADEKPPRIVPYPTSGVAKPTAAQQKDGGAKPVSPPSR